MVSASTTTAPTLFVVRNASEAGTLSKIVDRRLPAGYGSSGGKSPTITGSPIARRPTTSRRSRARERQRASPTRTGTKKVQISTSGDVR